MWRVQGSHEAEWKKTEYQQQRGQGAASTKLEIQEIQMNNLKKGTNCQQNCHCRKSSPSRTEKIFFHIFAERENGGSGAEGHLRKKECSSFHC
jgi:hypothetical protein